MTKKKQAKPELCPETLRWVAEDCEEAALTWDLGTSGRAALLDQAVDLRNLATRAEKKRGKQR